MKERVIQSQIIKELERRNWYVHNTHGNMFQEGLPDLYCLRKGMNKWVEVKRKERYRFTEGQLTEFPLIDLHGGEIYVLTDVSEVGLMSEAPNWKKFLKITDLAYIKEKYGTRLSLASYPVPYK